MLRVTLQPGSAPFAKCLAQLPDHVMHVDAVGAQVMTCMSGGRAAVSRLTFFGWVRSNTCGVLQDTTGVGSKMKAVLS